MKQTGLVRGSYSCEKHRWRPSWKRKKKKKKHREKTVRACVKAAHTCAPAVVSWVLGAAARPQRASFLWLGLLWLQRWPAETLHCWSLFTVQPELAKGTGEKRGEGSEQRNGSWTSLTNGGLKGLYEQKLNGPRTERGSADKNVVHKSSCLLKKYIQYP